MVRAPYVTIFSLAALVVTTGCWQRTPEDLAPTDGSVEERSDVVGTLESHPGSLSAGEIAVIAERSVVTILVYESGIQKGNGSGFFVDEGLVATNYHVIEPGDSWSIKRLDDDISYTGNVLAVADSEADLAVLRVSMRSEKPLVLGSYDRVSRGDLAYAIGSPFGLESTFSDGIVSAFREFEGREYLQLTTPLSPGSSGGPILNDRAEVIGVAVAIIAEGENVSFAVPVRDLRSLLSRIP